MAGQKLTNRQKRILWLVDHFGLWYGRSSYDRDGIVTGLKNAKLLNRTTAPSMVNVSSMLHEIYGVGGEELFK